MNDCNQHDVFNLILSDFHPDRYAVSRSVALYSAAITLSNHDSLNVAVQVCSQQGVSREQMYETVLQSYLFLGFPRMLSAAECLHELFPVSSGVMTKRETAQVQADRWLERGRELCRKVYDGSYDALKSRVESMAPEIFLWMELEGYGKVLSRPGLDIVDREIAIVACLTVENRAAQLHSHLRGALNVGAQAELLVDVVRDLRPIAEDGFATACELLPRLGVKL